MAVTYFKRFRMDVHMDDAPEPPELPPGYFWVAWNPSLIEVHAEVKYQSFRGEIDATVFPSLGTRAGCLDLMKRLVRKSSFVPEATWLLACAEQYCGTIQGITEEGPTGAVQNVGVIEKHRRQGLARALVVKALEGFHRVGLRDAFLEVTAQNSGAVQLYESLGFRSAKTLYKAVHT